MKSFALSLTALVALGLVGLVGLVGSPAPPARAANCAFVLGFKNLHDLIPATVGDCRTDEYHNAQNGDGLQEATGGLLVWRKADNWTAFTNGSTTWLNGPQGLQSRPNDERFDWEGDREIEVQVFFSHQPESDNDFSAVFPVARTVTFEGQRVATATLEALILGPTAAEKAQGYFSELGGMLKGQSSCAGQAFKLTVDQGLATVKLCRQTQSAGIGQDARVQSEIDATLKQFPSIQRVRVLTGDGHCLFDQSGLDRCLQM